MYVHMKRITRKGHTRTYSRETRDKGPNGLAEIVRFDGSYRFRLNVAPMRVDLCARIDIVMNCNGNGCDVGFFCLILFFRHLIHLSRTVPASNVFVLKRELLRNRHIQVLTKSCSVQKSCNVAHEHLL